MIVLIGYEDHRVGDFTIKSRKGGAVNLYSDTQMLVIYGKTENPEKDFNFEFDAFKEDKKVGTFEFKYDMISAPKYKIITLACKENAELTITLICAVSFPLQNPPTGKVELHLPKHIAIGHRGSGANVVAKEFLENTMPGFMKAYERKADVVEFDVQLVDDETPVIFHDFTLEVKEPIEGIKPNSVEEGKILYAWQQLNTKIHRESGLTTDYKCERPTFKELMTDLPKDLVLDIEIKYPFSKLFRDKIPYAERNHFLQRVIDEMNAYVGDRELFFSAFCPLVVVMLATKQSRWPVYQLMTVEKDETFEKFLLKVRSFAPLHKELGINGFVLDSEHLLKEPKLATELINMGFQVSTYGKPNNTVEAINQQLDLGLTGICTDTMEQCRRVIDEYDAAHK
ncbi:Glycerophosphoryl diester phosphodiesterase family protein [Trichomonas vaginalis G3]|uniref:Glycerophosphoryl diester phosphodiesterase family protein n=1 Tax=Trichomonas vaginalis (strain ATCC PRA-98 / G3) TaxID=412133 RepID=A2DIH7_TRIV3|nr:glycerophosphocholine phosphodiesterase protein [Trichomonas vaginalis G3]EAY19781.1 Glycerophosphoryl diester phosphodiesterase family protein [Trichomonas vaginalis G3]KAI5523904.1 glycerophosphocholine phosphodiesterase protein [Trichomonas vaginalis G3]|eukprot:XP_001580767.1 Glycerophosphoryl diester phosphodiesterase family protein [Trichomonas vaginalis G3]